MKKIRKKTNFVVLLCAFCMCLTAFGKPTTFDININNQLDNKISVSPTEDFSALAESVKNIISKSSGEKQLFPSIFLEEVTNKNSIFGRSQKDSLELPALKRTGFFATIGEINFKELNVTENPFIVQRLVIKNSENNEIVGYISFRCSVYNTNPIITTEESKNYTISVEQIPFGGGIYFIIKKL